MRGYMIGTVDLGAIDLGNIEGRDRGALARVLGAKSYRDEQGRWRFAGGVVDCVRLDHPTVLRVLGEPLEACGPVRWEPLRDDVRGPDVPAPAADWQPGPAVLDWFNGLTDEAECEQAAALMAEQATGYTADMVPGITPAQFARLSDTFRGLVAWDAAGIDEQPAPAHVLPADMPCNTGNLYNDAAVFIGILSSVQARRAAVVEIVALEQAQGVAQLHSERLVNRQGVMQLSSASDTAAPDQKPRYRLNLDGSCTLLSPGTGRYAAENGTAKRAVGVTQLSPRFPFGNILSDSPLKLSQAQQSNSPLEILGPKMPVGVTQLHSECLKRTVGVMQLCQKRTVAA